MEDQPVSQDNDVVTGERAVPEETVQPKPNQIWLAIRGHVRPYFIINTVYFVLITILGSQDMVSDKIVLGSLVVIMMYMMLELFVVVAVIQDVQRGGSGELNKKTLLKAFYTFLSIAIVLGIAMILGIIK